ncbi:MAG: FAD-dependent oxidoreductase, partial [Oscillospiraceae bacterium]|nr:FAD-dependent oxidoreductase [Oscillospiraceae bacterium]
NQIIDFLRKYVPGYTGCKLKGSGSTLGVRETRRIMGDYVISDHDVETGARQEDVLVHNAWFLIDIHNPAGGGQAEGRSQPAVPYDIPYRSMLPAGVDGLLTSGRCISGTHRAHASYRIGGVCLATGQAAGTAAALAALSKVTPRALDVRKVQKALEKQGAALFDN